MSRKRGGFGGHFLGLGDKGTQTLHLFSAGLEAKHPKARYWQGWFLLEALKVSGLHARLLASGGGGSPCQPFAC